MQAIHQLRNVSNESLTRFVGWWNNPSYYWITRPLVAFITTRLIVFIAAYLAEIAIPGLSGAGLYHVNPNDVFLDVWARWDSAFYLSIVERGYFFQIGTQSSVAFFPLYPLLISLLAPLVGILAAGVIVSHTCFFGALVFLYRLTEFEFHDSRTAARTVFYIASFPTAFFFSAVYTESTFLLFSVATFYFARRHLWAWAMLFGILCSATRIVGFTMVGVVGLEWLAAHGWTLGTLHKIDAWRNLIRGLRTDSLNLLLILMIPLGLISYMVFLYTTYGDPIAFNTTQAAWGRETLGFWTVIPRDLFNFLGGNFLTGDIWYHIALDIGAFFLVVAVALVLWRRLGASYALYCLISILIPASSGSGSLSRYALMAFPVFMMLGWWGRSSTLDRAITISFSVFLGVLTTVFVNWIFVA